MTYQQLFKVSEAATLIAEVTGGDKFDVARRISNDTRLTNFQFYDSEGRAFQCSQVPYGITSDIPGKGPLKFSDAQCFFHRMDINQLLNFLGYHPSIQEKILNARPLIESATCPSTPEPQQSSEPAPMVADSASNATVAKETPLERRIRWLNWWGTGGRGAVQRVYERELLQNPKADRSYIGKQITKAKTEQADKKLDGKWAYQLVRDGKRTS